MTSWFFHEYVNSFRICACLLVLTFPFWSYKMIFFPSLHNNDTLLFGCLLCSSKTITLLMEVVSFPFIFLWLSIPTQWFYSDCSLKTCITAQVFDASRGTGHEFSAFASHSEMYDVPICFVNPFTNLVPFGAAFFYLMEREGSGISQRRNHSVELFLLAPNHSFVLYKLTGCGCCVLSS